MLFPDQPVERQSLHFLMRRLDFGDLLGQVMQRFVPRPDNLFCIGLGRLRPLEFFPQVLFPNQPIQSQAFRIGFCLLRTLQFFPKMLFPDQPVERQSLHFLMRRLDFGELFGQRRQIAHS